MVFSQSYSDTPYSFVLANRNKERKARATYTVVKAGGIFLLLWIFRSYFMKIVQPVFQKIFSTLSVDTFPEVFHIFPSSVIYKE
jgi:hypothetical protein